MSLPIRVRMTAWYVALLAIVLGGIGAFVVVRLRADLIGETDAALRPAARKIALGYRREGPVELRDTARTALSGERPAAQALGPDGRVLVSYGDPVARAPMLGASSLGPALRGDLAPRTVELRPGSARFRLVASPVLHGGRRRVVVAGRSLAPVERSVHRVLALLLLACPVALLATTLGGWWLARRSLRPIDHMTTAAGAIGVDRLDERLAEPRTSDEVARLARTLNTMLGRIQRGTEEQRRLVADASHELRTPLAAMRSELDVSLRTDHLSPAARGVLESAREEVDHLSRMVDDLLTLASADEDRLALAAEPLELQQVAARAAEGLRSSAARRDILLELRGGAAPVVGDPERLCQAARNLVENAIEFTSRGQRVTLTTTATDGSARLTVADGGPGVAREHRELIFERFFRVDPSRTRRSGGSGLGLAIAREIVAAHGGRVWVEPAQPCGSVFCIELPLGP